MYSLIFLFKLIFLNYKNTLKKLAHIIFFIKKIKIFISWQIKSYMSSLINKVKGVSVCRWVVMGKSNNLDH
jgi:hypothetical protein